MAQTHPPCIIIVNKTLCQHKLVYIQRPHFWFLVQTRLKQIGHQLQEAKARVSRESETTTKSFMLPHNVTYNCYWWKVTISKYCSKYSTAQSFNSKHLQIFVITGVIWVNVVLLSKDIVTILLWPLASIIALVLIGYLYRTIFFKLMCNEIYRYCLICFWNAQSSPNNHTMFKITYIPLFFILGLSWTCLRE